MPVCVLIIDVDRTVTDGAARDLPAHGYRVFTATNGEEGLRLFRAVKPEIVVTELLMPGCDGIECIIQIKREAPGTRIVATTSGGVVERDYCLHVARSLGAESGLSKPFTIRQLADAVAAVRRKGSGGS